jgi:triosephosphate isomerase (TIM)
MTSSRKPLVVGNWKANPPRAELDGLTGRLVDAVGPIAEAGVDVVVCPPFPWLATVATGLAGSGIQLGTQTLAVVDSGGVTGEVPASLLRGLCDYALLGHYERRIQCEEDNGDIRKKVVAAIENNIRPIFCVGESAEALEHGASGGVLAEQMEAVLDGLSLDSRLVIAYAPIWTTIGMIIPPEASYVNDVCAMLRETLADITSADLAAQARIIYGGRLTESNVLDLAAQPEIDGFLVGAGATSPPRFALMAGAVRQARQP